MEVTGRDQNILTNQSVDELGGCKIKGCKIGLGLLGEKMTFFRFFFPFAYLNIETKLFCFYQNFISSTPIFGKKMTTGGKKNYFFRFSWFRFHIFTSRRNFFVFTKVAYLLRHFSAKQLTKGRTNKFFRIFSCCSTSSRRDETFLFLPKFHIFSRSEKSGGDKEKALHQRRTNDEWTTNDEQRTTTNYIDDHNTPSGFSESSG